MTDYSDNVEKIKPSVVKVISNRNAGSGFIVHKKGIVITANHVVVSDASRTKVKFFDGCERNCSNIIYKNKKRDFAILEIEMIIIRLLI
jgi:S1-C subfamily serine protease